MLAPGEIGKQVREYFIQVERAFYANQEPQPEFAQLRIHANEDFQISNSKMVNSAVAAGRIGMDHREYHTITQKDITGKTPHEWKDHADETLPLGPRNGKPSKKMSARQIIRKLQPEGAAGLSCCDVVTNGTRSVEKGIEAGKAAKTLYGYLLEAGAA